MYACIRVYIFSILCVVFYVYNIVYNMCNVLCDIRLYANAMHSM